jgi:hypothetical protein
MTNTLVRFDNGMYGAQCTLDADNWFIYEIQEKHADPDNEETPDTLITVQNGNQIHNQLPNHSKWDVVEIIDAPELIQTAFDLWKPNGPYDNAPC